MKKLILFLLFSCIWTLLPAQMVLKLWPDGAPGDNGLTEVKHADGTYQQVTDPEMEVYLPESPNGQAVIICPGGSYSGLAFNHEGRDVARWMAERGIVGIVLKYRMPGGKEYIPLTDFQKAIVTVREMASKLGVDPGKVGVMGFSAGGHLAASAVTMFESREHRPDFGILVYPVISMTDELTHFESRKNLTGEESYYSGLGSWSAEDRVGYGTPPVLIFFSHDDKVVDPRNGTVFYNACVQNPSGATAAELHIYPSGGHGWGWREDFKYSGEVKAVTERWLSER